MAHFDRQHLFQPVELKAAIAVFLPQIRLCSQPPHSRQSQALSFFALNTETEETSLAVRFDMKEREGLVRTSPIPGPRW